jgi:regulator-associated protein of mTOR
MESKSFTSFFFTDHLTAFEIWLDFGGSSNKSIKGKIDSPPIHLPILLQVLLSQAHRLRALQLLRRYLAMGAEAVNSALIVGIFPYIMKLLQSPAGELRKVLVSIWASILGFDSSCRGELVRDKCHTYFIQYLSAKDTSSSQRCKAAFVLAEICSGFKEGKVSCTQNGLLQACIGLLKNKELTKSNDLKKWIALCIAKLCEDNIAVKQQCLAESSHNNVFPLLINEDPCVRGAAALALGEIFGSYTSSIINSQGMNSPGAAPGGNANKHVNSLELRQIELLSALQILECCTDGSVLVRREAIIALSKFTSVDIHIPVLKDIMRFLLVRNGQLDMPKLWENILTSDSSAIGSDISAGAKKRQSNTPSKSGRMRTSSGSSMTDSSSMSDLIERYTPIFYQLQPNEMHDLVGILKFNLLDEYANRLATSMSNNISRSFL